MQQKVKGKQVIDFIIVFIMTVGCLLYFSAESPLYQDDFWIDVNSHMIMGRALNHGLTLYRDIYDTKGPFVFCIAQIANLISDNTFIGFWFVEVIAIFSYVWFALKAIRIIQKDESISIVYAILTLVIYMTCLYQACTFTIEQLVLGALSYVLYLYTKVVFKQVVRGYEYVISGLIIAMIFWAKFNYIVLFGVVYLLLFIYWCKKQNIGYALRQIGLTCLGFVIFTGYICWKYNFNILWNEYFKILFVYADNGKKSFLLNVVDLPWYYLVSLPCAVCCIFAFLFEKNKEIRLCYSLVYIVQCLILVWFYNGIIYYFLPFICLVPYGLFYGIKYCFKNLNRIKQAVILGIVIFYCFALLATSSNLHMMHIKNDCLQYKMANYIEQSNKDKTLIYDFKKIGDITVMNKIKSIPSIKYWTSYNFIPFQEDEHNLVIANKQVSYIITDTDKTYQGYHLVLKGKTTNSKGIVVTTQHYLWEIDD